MELMQGGDLLNRILDRGAFKEDKARKVFGQILDGVAYLHSKGLVHRDIKPENVLLSSPGENFDAKLTDFGLSTNASTQMQTFCGTPAYFAPEIIRTHNRTLDGYNKSVDIWALGV